MLDLVDANNWGHITPILDTNITIGQIVAPIRAFPRIKVKKLSSLPPGQEKAGWGEGTVAGPLTLQVGSKNPTGI